MSKITATEEEIRLNEREKCALEIERFAIYYVAKWADQSVNIKSEGWAILQAAVHLRISKITANHE